MRKSVRGHVLIIRDQTDGRLLHPGFEIVLANEKKRIAPHRIREFASLDTFSIDPRVQLGCIASDAS